MQRGINIRVMNKHEEHGETANGIKLGDSLHEIDLMTSSIPVPGRAILPTVRDCRFSTLETLISALRAL